jgi:hypothetical protein
VVKNPETGRYTLIKGGNTRLLAFKALYRETSDTKFAAIDCIVEADSFSLLKSLLKFLSSSINALALSTNINSPRASFSIKCAITACVHGDNIEPIIRRIPVQSIDEYAFNPRQANNNVYLKETVEVNMFS